LDRLLAWIIHHQGTKTPRTKDETSKRVSECAGWRVTASLAHSLTRPPLCLGVFVVHE